MRGYRNTRCPEKMRCRASSKQFMKSPFNFKYFVPVSPFREIFLIIDKVL